jgi:hypothetical protein
MKTNSYDDTRRSFLGRLAQVSLIPAALLAGSHPTRAAAPQGRRVLLNDFSIAGFQYYEGPPCLRSLREGAALTLRAEPQNPHDEFAVEILHGTTKLGYVPRFCNRHLSRMLGEGVELRCEVARVDSTAPPWDAVAVCVLLPVPPTGAPRNSRPVSTTAVRP